METRASTSRARVSHSLARGELRVAEDPPMRDRRGGGEEAISRFSLGRRSSKSRVKIEIPARKRERRACSIALLSRFSSFAFLQPPLPDVLQSRARKKRIRAGWSFDEKKKAKG